MNRTVLCLFAVVLFTVTTGCSSTTVIRSKPAGATVRNLKGEKICKTPCSFSGGGTINSTEQFTIEKDGFEELPLTIKKDQVNGFGIAGWAAAAFFTALPTFGLGLGFLVPIAWMADYQPAYNVELDPVPAPPGPAAQVTTVPMAYQGDGRQR